MGAFNSNIRPRLILLFFVLFAVGLSVRFIDLSDPPLDFHSARQMHDALIARAFYLVEGGTLPNETGEYISEAMNRGLQEAIIEPPIFDWLVSRLYLIAGDADLRIPRVCSIFFWLAGGIGLIRLTRRFFSTPGVLASIAFYLFYPYCIIASRSFQPDILMVSLMIWSLDTVCHWVSKPKSILRAVIAGLVTGLAIFVKQVAAIPLGLSIAAYLITVFGLQKCLSNGRVWLIGFLSVFPVLAYNFWGYFIDGFLVQQYQGRFDFSELTQAAFYIRWMRMIDKSITIPLFICGVMGCFVIHRHSFRALWAAYLAGYVLYGFLLPHHISTHDYYQLPVIPAIAAGLGACFDVIYQRVQDFHTWRRFSVFGVCATLFFVSCWWVSDSVMTMNKRDYRDWPERWKTLAPELEPYENRISSIGLMADDGSAMSYWGLKSPGLWTSNVEQMSDYNAQVTLNTTMWNYLFFVVTDLDRFYEQPRLQRYLNANAVIFEEGKDYLIYDLREK